MKSNNLYLKKILLFGFAFILQINFTLIAQQKWNVIIDADTGNEVDDLYALVRALMEPTWNITALNATQWQTAHWAVEQSMENSHRLNQVLVAYFPHNIKTLRGGYERMFDWGDLAQHSAAAYEIINQAKALKNGEKLNIVALGALTNIASAIFIEPNIENHINLYWLGTAYDFENDILKRNDFNSVMDVQALEILLNSKVEMTIIPTTAAANLTFNFIESKKKIEELNPLGEFLIKRWFDHFDGGRKERILWDLALIEAIIHPEFTKQKQLVTSKDNGSKLVNYIYWIDPEKMKNDFFQTFYHFKLLD
ncbi:nucleoside hydrolase [Namhaeicola litoreus]|uniref:Nucleoside hydrolase n=1 Tax=Namhaeicola litoreus TaxID=1052145 RepID=A0ABW3Y665_9FLAO